MIVTSLFAQGFALLIIYKALNSYWKTIAIPTIAAITNPPRINVTYLIAPDLSSAEKRHNPMTAKTTIGQIGIISRPDFVGAAPYIASDLYSFRGTSYIYEHCQFQKIDAHPL